MTKREEFDLVLSGSGTLLPCHVGAVSALIAAGYDPVRFAGTSGGSIVAAALAQGMSTDEVLELCKRFLKKDLLKKNWWFFNGWGLNKHERIEKLLSEYLPGSMMDSKEPLKIVGVDMETQSTEIFYSELDLPKNRIPIATAAMGSAAIPVFFQVVRPERVPGTFIDGGARANFALSVWDDVPARRTIGIRFRHTHRRRKVEGTKDYLQAMIGLLADNANHTYISKKRYASVIDINSRGDGMQFDLSDGEVQDLYDEGWNAAQKWASKNPPGSMLPVGDRLVRMS